IQHYSCIHCTTTSAGIAILFLQRQVKSPKVYIADCGLLHALLDLADRTAIERHPILGESWDGQIINQLCAATDKGLLSKFLATWAPGWPA
ncbi:MAG TPA: DUF4143 domain-containing protein, partial [Ilumatobacteraceae bacterium]|nr:DUF4143 domain-containing protein [Ilumatobacteraceae bacterium]